MDAVYAVMAARVAEEEQTQRTMIALNEMKPSYPGKQQEEVKRVLDEVLTCCSCSEFSLFRVDHPILSIFELHTCTQVLP